MGKLKRLVIVACILLSTAKQDIQIRAASSASSTAEQEQDRIGQLPGQDFNVNFAHYAGYVTIDDKSGRNFFYWFIEAADPDTKPLALWLNGGPGCSSIAFGEAEEIGPFRPKEDGKSIYLNPYAWTQVANIIFLESPAGTGFSYSDNSSDILDVGDKKSARDNLAFILKWLERFPQYQGREFYIIGESYAGHFVPQLSQLIIRQPEDGVKINFKGFLIGNPLIDDYHDQRGIADFMYTVGLISKKSQKLLKDYCATGPYMNCSEECNNAHSAAAEEIGNLDYYSIITPVCTSNSITPSFSSRRWPVGLLNGKYDPCTEQHSIVYFNLPEVQAALHVRGAPVKWDTCSGNTDAVIPATSTIYSISALNLPTVSPHKPWYEDGQVAGWVEEYQGLTLVIVSGGGHEVPLHKPKQALSIFKSFLSGEPLSAPNQVSDS